MTTILIVDDSKLARIVAGKAVNALQPEWERVEAANADEAMTVLSQRQIDVALLDYNMPGRNGLELAAELRGLYPTMPIAIITANVQDEIIAHAHSLKTTFVIKPLNDEALRGFISGAALRLRAEDK
jgi:CheY-like chemotaxis protein